MKPQHWKKEKSFQWVHEDFSIENENIKTNNQIYHSITIDLEVDIVMGLSCCQAMMNIGSRNKCNFFKLAG